MSDAVSQQQKMTFRHLVRSPVAIAAGALLIAISVITIAPILFANNDADKKQERIQRNPISVETTSAKWVSEVEYRRKISGVIRAGRSSDLSFERAAKIVKVFVDDGDVVPDDFVVAALDVRDLEISERKVTAQLANAQAVFDELDAGPRVEVVESAAADMAALQAELVLATEVLQKRQTLWNARAISEEEWQRAESQYSAATQRWKSAKRKHDELKAGTREEKIRAQKGLVDQLKQELQQVQLDIKKSQLRSPFAGKVSRRYLDEGEVIAPGVPVIRLIEHTKLEAVVGYPVSAAADLNTGEKVKCIVNGNKVHGVVKRVLPEIDSETRNVPVVIELDSPRIKPGELVRIEVVEKRNLQGIWIPTVSMQPAAKGLWSVFVVKEDNSASSQTVADSRLVEVLFTDGDRTLVRGPIDDDELVICSGTQRITSGQPVEIDASNQ